LLAIISALILVLTYFVKDMFKERARDVAASAASAENLYRTESGQSTLSLQLMQIGQQISVLRQVNEPQVVGEERDYSDTIRLDSLRARQMSADLKSEVASLSRLIDGLPSDEAKEFKRRLEQLKPDIEKADQQVEEALKPSAKQDWTRLAQVKIGVVVPLLARLPVLILGDAVLTSIQRTRESAERLYRFSQWASYVLYAIGVALGLYAALSRIKGLGAGE
jgi:hypothetical protein